ncbi:MMPL family transporter [Paractinoplanes durhamensis]|uniref:Membrane protein n=1 Tax=Paractinoplanes durhamensis TaxID=113563 RepID=A0ABQ3Z9J8_9ACTN|nr:MMPL family transporter [Actinoplanes durhamensis]GIE06508.1 membrane protein [Actinoplanes durhamensis]
MATLLYRLGRFSFRRRRRMTALWVVVFALLGLGAATLSGPTSNAFSIPGTESSRALEVIAEKMGGGGTANTASATVVFTVGGDATLAGTAQQAALKQAVTALGAAPDVAAVTQPTLSADKQTAYATVSYTIGQADVTEADREALFAAGRTVQSAGVGVEFGGTATEANEAGGATEVIGVAVAAVVLIITFGALVAAGLPLLTAILSVLVGMLGIRIATGFFDLSTSTSALALMLGLAVGIDYALFVVSRYRHELAEGREPEDAAGRALGTAGSAVVFAGLTVFIALAALSVVGIPFLTSMGLAAAGTVAVAVLITLTLLPALLGFAGRKVLPKRPRKVKGVAFGERWARGIVKHRVPALVLTAGALIVIALPATQLRLALPDASTAAQDSTQRKAYDQLAEGFGAGFNGPLIVVVEAGAGQAKTAGAAAQKIIEGLGDVALVTPPAANQAGDTALLTVMPKSSPNSTETEDLVAAIRDQRGSVSGATLSVTGTTALNIDVSEKLSAALLPYLSVVVGLAILLLMLVFRSIAVPLKATLGFLLSVAATFGAVVAVFQWGWLAGLFGVDNPGPIISMMPIFLIGVLFGLAMDYEVFLVTRAREEYVHGAGPDEAIITGVRHGARVVTAAALIMMSVFAGFLLADDAIIKSLGFALAFGVAVDAFLVRMTIVPAVLSLLGRAAWWLPRWLDRALPNVDIEGEKLSRTLGDRPAEEDRPLVSV